MSFKQKFCGIWFSYRLRVGNRLPQQGGDRYPKMALVNLIVYDPETKAGQEELTRRVSDVHAVPNHLTDYGADRSTFLHDGHSIDIRVEHSYEHVNKGMKWTANLSSYMGVSCTLL